MAERRIIAELLDNYRRRRWTLASAESCTGGLLAAALTAIPGASEIFLGGWVTYANAMKIDALGISEQQLTRHGAVSSEIAAAMAEGAALRAKSDIAIGITGIAGPGGATPEKPVGLVYIGLAGRMAKRRVVECRFSGDRDRVRAAACDRAIALLAEALDG